MNREKGLAYCGLACCVCSELVGDITEIYFKDRSIREISDMLSIPKSTAQRQKTRILKKLFDLLEKNE